MPRQEQSHSDGPENNSCQKIEITGSKKMPYNHDYSEHVERRSNTMKHPINWVPMSTFDCLNKTKRHFSLISLIVMIISDWLTLADKALINVLYYFSHKLNNWELLNTSCIPEDNLFHMKK